MKQRDFAVEAFKNSLKQKKSISVQGLSSCLNEMGRYRDAIGYLTKKYRLILLRLYGIFLVMPMSIWAIWKALLAYKGSMKKAITIDCNWINPHNM